MSYVKLMLLALKANNCLFPSQLPSSLTFITKALQLPGIEATCRSASIKAFHLLRVIPSHTLVQAHFTAAVVLQLFFPMSEQGQALFFARSFPDYVVSSFFMASAGFRLAVTAPAPEVYDVSVPRLWAATSTQDCGVGGPVLAS